MSPCGFQFAELCLATTGDANRYQFVTMDKASRNFGHGVHACPGRFLASKEIKTILTYVIRKCDIKVPQADAEARFDDSWHGGVSPDWTAVLMYRKRQVID